MLERTTGTITAKDFVELQQRTAVTPESYTKPIRLYCDIDGVLQPYIYGEEDLEQIDVKTTVNIIDTTRWSYSDDGSLRIVKGDFYYNKAVAQKLSEWSNHPLIDFVWLTAWRVNAPYALDEALNINSIGWLPWDAKMSDYNHSFKKVAIIDDQLAAPSSFIWLEDLANRIHDPEEPELFTRYEYDFTEEDPTPTKNQVIHPQRYLSVNTNSLEGLTAENITMVEEWLNNF